MGLLTAALYGPEERLGLLSDRGAFDQYARYVPGQMVTDGGVAYLCTAAVGTALELEDTFQRPDQVGWGQSSHGEYWETSDAFSGAGPAVLRGGRGLLQQLYDSRSDAQLLGPSRARADAEVLCRVSLSVPTGSDPQGVVLYLNATEDESVYASVSLLLAHDGTASALIQTATSGNAAELTDLTAVSSVDGGGEVWLRLRRIGLVYHATMWPSGAPEASAPQISLTTTHAQPAGHLVLAPYAGVSSDVASVGYVGLRPLTAATAPADDTAHWTPLAEALAVPAPL